MGLLEPDGRGRRTIRRDALSGDAPVIVVHSLAHAVAALSAAAEAGVAVTLLSAKGAGIYAGAAWFREVIAAAREAEPDAHCTALLDCGEDAGSAQTAIRAGVEGIVFTGRTDVAARLADIAAGCGVRLLTARPTAELDLADAFFAAPKVLQGRCLSALAAEKPPNTPRLTRATYATG